MNGLNTELWRYLSEQIAMEQNLASFSNLFDEICLLLEQREAELIAQQDARPVPESRGHRRSN